MRARVSGALCALVMCLPFVIGAHAGAATPSVTVSAKSVVIRAGTNDMSCPAVYPDFCDQPFRGNDAAVRVRFATGFTSISSACFTFRFSGDLLDPGEYFRFNLGGGGFGYELDADAPSSLAVRTLCLGSPDLHPQVASLFDGHQAFDVWMVRGSAYLGAVEVSVTGTPSSHP